MKRSSALRIDRHGKRHGDQSSVSFQVSSETRVVVKQPLKLMLDGKTSGPDDALTIDLRNLENLSVDALRERYRELKQSSLSKYLRRPFALMVVSHAVREQALGGLSGEAQKRLDQLVAQIVPSGEAPPTKPIVRKVKPGTRLLREWKGEIHEVLVAPDGFIWKGERCRSLSEIARAITGTRWNGWKFFGIDEPANSERKKTKGASDRAGAMRRAPELANA